ncbi:MAG: recombinase family protein, partial [Chloroflexi bacterium]|nr:recombinase family protein [Chloroflexota bacterium]
MPDPKSMPVLLELLRCYATGRYSYQTLAGHLNARGCRTRNGRPFTIGSIAEVLENRFYDGKVVWHPGEPDEEVWDGLHEVPTEVRELWRKCQAVNRTRSRQKEGRPRHPDRPYIFSKVALCAGCGLPYGAQPVYRDNGQVVRRLYHKRPFCVLEPHSVRVERLAAQF